MDPLMLAMILGAGALALSDDETIVTPPVFKAIERQPVRTMAFRPPDGLALPAEALAAYKSGGKLKRGSWVRYAIKGKKFERKLKKIRFYSKPRGAGWRTSKSKVRNLCWMALAPKEFQPKYGAWKRNARLSILKPILGPKADWQTLTGAFEEAKGMVEDAMGAAGIVGGAVATSGASVASDPGAAVSGIASASAGILEGLGNIADDVKARKKAADAIILAIAASYEDAMKRANPHAVKNGKLDIGKKYKSDPKTFGDLRAPGNARPLLYIPREVGR